MGYVVRFGSVSKRVNSTYQPDYTSWWEASCVWKSPTDIDTPVLTVFVPDSTAAPQWNMFYMQATNAYYWIRSIRAVNNGRYEIAGVMDCMATYRQQILNTDCYILYGFNEDASAAAKRLPDTRQNIAQVPSVTTAKVDITDGLFDVNGFYVITCVGASGGVSAYKVTYSNMRRLLDSVSADIHDQIEAVDTIEDIFKIFSINQLMQSGAVSSIQSCMWFPLSDNAYSGSVQRIYLGDFDTGVSGVLLGNNPIVTRETSIAIPWPVSDWRRMNCQLILYVPFIGTVAIPVDQCNNESSLTIRWCCELIGGGVSVRINAGNYPVYTGTAQLGTNYAIGSSNVPAQNIVAGLATAAGGAIQVGGGIATAIAATPATAVTGGAIGSETMIQSVQAIGQGVSNIGSGIMQTITPVIQCAGALTGAAAMGQSKNAELTVLYYAPIDDAAFSAVYGHPVMAMGKPAYGYCQTLGFSVAIPGRADEMERINAAMDRGVFIE